ncbi:MAG: PAS domain-containing protein [Nitrospira sp.]|nr:PAS domain-containing protein [Nitrospira sp.]MBH0187163.1 PAS domain-containing protein [Nitrospira sp.]
MWWSPNARVKFGGDPSGEVWVSRLHPDDRDRVLAQVQDALSSKALRYSAEYRFRLEDGSYGHFLDRASIIQDSSGKPTRMIGAMIDMTSAKKAYLSLQEAYHPGFRS